MSIKEPLSSIMFVSGRKPDDIIEQELARLGIKVQWANSVNAAADLLGSISGRIGVLTDLALVDGNWRDVVERVRAVSGSIPIVAVSSSVTAELWWDALDFDVEDILSTPLSTARLCEALGAIGQNHQ